MKILLVSAGSRKNGATERALREAEARFIQLGAECTKIWIGDSEIHPCNGCGACKVRGDCIRQDDAKMLESMIPAHDGYMFFTPVHYGGASGVMKSALGRIFTSRRSDLEYKAGAAVAISRRGGNVTALEELTRFFSFASMICVNGNYPGIIHGTEENEAEMDGEGLQTVRSIADNMVWILRCIEHGRRCGIEHPIQEKKIKTSYIR